MKILFPIAIFYPATVGGPSSTLYWHSCYLTSKGVETYVVTTDTKIDSDKYNIKYNQWIKNEIGNVIYCKSNINIFPFREIYSIISKIVDVDLIHYSSAYYYSTIYTIIIGILLRKKIVLSPRGEFFPVAINNKKKRFVIKLYKIISKWIIFHATSTDEYNCIKHLFPISQIVIQPNFIDLKTSPKNRIISKNIVFLGIIYSVKKIENLIKAVSISKHFFNSNSKVLIAGKPLVNRDFQYKKMLDKLIIDLHLENKVHFIGEIFGKEKETFLNEAYILVLPSDSENFGNVVIESLSQSTPVIASDGTPWKILNETKSGWCVKNDSVSLCEAIDDALSMSEDNYFRMCERGRNLVTEKYDIYNSPENKWLEIYTLNN